jgi:hypothetical protein
MSQNPQQQQDTEFHELRGKSMVSGVDPEKSFNTIPNSTVERNPIMQRGSKNGVMETQLLGYQRRPSRP